MDHPLTTDPDSANADRVTNFLRDQHGLVLTFRQAHDDSHPAAPVLRALWRWASERVQHGDAVAHADRVIEDLIAMEREITERAARIPAARASIEPEETK